MNGGIRGYQMKGPWRQESEFPVGNISALLVCGVP